MPIKTKIETKGFAEFLEKVTKMGQNIDQITDEALAAGGDYLLKGMQSRVPVLTGELRTHLSCSEPKQDGDFHYIEVGLDLGEKLPDYGKKMGKKVGKNWKSWGRERLYGVYVEFGTANTPAQPFIRPTMDEDMKDARKAMRQVFKEQGAL